eukprot:CAMPEP_0202866204 /NCGR_PEP_ID=MMETSP1391-20130828/7261_1 /ASSEMBLY_ACC=CAM_ASM_000867 /TAXON_ID=1034604 /ORGANISM="Chlamydomonas leiostraca, Strain SAG 11-49" /LENGTH=35 /DNA_ID= /DNA_START= /DNA_END= /DNA_ORIENTATION=
MPPACAYKSQSLQWPQCHQQLSYLAFSHAPSCAAH